MSRTTWTFLCTFIAVSGLLLSTSGCGDTAGRPSLDELAESIDLESLEVESSSSPQPTEPASEKVAEEPAAVSKALNLEKDQLKFGFIKLTDCAPIVIAKEKGFFEKEGLQVDVEAQPNWKTLLDRVINGELDGAHMLSGQPIAATIGFGTEAHIITAFTMDLNGNAITVSNAIWEQMQQHDPKLNSPQPEHPITATALRPHRRSAKGIGRVVEVCNGVSGVDA